MKIILKALRKSSFISSYKKFVIALVIVVYFGSNVLNSMDYLKGGTKDFNSLTEEDLGKCYVSGTINEVIDKVVVKNTTSNNIFAKNDGDYFIIPYGEESYIAMYLPKKYSYQKETLIKESADFMAKKLTKVESGIAVDGSIGFLKYDERKYFENHISNYDYASQKLFYPLILRVGMIGSTSYLWFAAYSAATIAGIIWMIIIILNFISGSNYKKTLRKYCNSKPDSNLARKELEQIFVEGKITNNDINIRFNDKLIILYYIKLCFIQKEQLIWVYSTNSKLKYFPGINITFKTKEGKSYLLFTNNLAAKLVIDKLKAFYPEVLFGYTEELNLLYKNDRQSFISLAKSHDNKKEEKEKSLQ